MKQIRLFLFRKKKFPQSRKTYIVEIWNLPYETD